MEKLRKGKLYLLLAVSCQPLKSFVSRIAISVGLLFVCVYVHMRTCVCVHLHVGFFILTHFQHYRRV